MSAPDYWFAFGLVVWVLLFAIRLTMLVLVIRRAPAEER